ncbi:hypothetical protein RchiOBHm_Chr4g0413811 [Rosa chinensis]|uniref:Uncharacterized protein n=1 Tax=Rosa chinensis TaxID=74649 RepID=A0A2P6QW52_ROSCH|nr:hypothetical protein RchiOBHm_Chr4g0413811 [Rosa chinensis]
MILSHSLLVLSSLSLSLSFFFFFHLLSYSMFIPSFSSSSYDFRHTLLLFLFPHTSNFGSCVDVNKVADLQIGKFSFQIQILPCWGEGQEN